ncbi:MAG TPA: SDR family oxidoreductase [Thermoanaerobaculia bacterium]|jgi:NAD(P)-dependent dehydrogenase (short-subunit alcohol dehydrogenase family)
MNVVVITGASAGVGRATAREFAARGARIGLIARNQEALENAKREVEARGGQAVVAVANVSDPDAVERTAQLIEDTLGPIDVWINNAMASVLGPITDIPPDEFRRVTEVTYLGVVHGTQAALRRMLPRNQGVIVQVGSTLAYRGIPLQAPYCAAKHAVQGFHDALRCELLHLGTNVQTCMINLPAINTPQFRWIRNHMPRKPKPFGTIFEPEVAARAIVAAAERPSREVNVSWGTTQAILANGIAPGALDRYLGRIGFDAQQDEKPEEPGRQDNLFTTPPGDGGAHGVFGDRAKSTLLPWRAIAIAVGALALLAAAKRRYDAPA